MSLVVLGHIHINYVHHGEVVDIRAVNLSQSFVSSLTCIRDCNRKANYGKFVSIWSLRVCDVHRLGSTSPLRRLDIWYTICMHAFRVGTMSKRSKHSSVIRGAIRVYWSTRMI